MKNIKGPTKSDVLELRKKLEKRGRLIDTMQNNLRRDFQKMYGSCPHKWGTQFFGDPSGGSDSWNQCNVCGGSAD